MARGKEKKLIVEIPEELHSQLKIYSALMDKSMKVIVIDSLKTAIKPFSSIIENLMKSKSKVKVTNVLTATIKPRSVSQGKTKKKK